MAPLARGGIFSVWGDLNQCLPVGNDQADKVRRDTIFNELDILGNGIVRQVDFKKAMFRRMPAVKGIDDMAGLVNQAFVGGRKVVEPVAMLGDNQIDRNQFRGVLLYLHCYFKLWDLFLQHGVEPGDAFTARDLAGLVPVLRNWGVQEISSWEENTEEVFRLMDQRGSGAVNFNQLADFAVRYALPQLMESDEGTEEEKARAKQLIQKWLPHVAERKAVAQRPGWNGIAPPLAPPGQKRPPRAILGMRAEVEAKRAGSPNSRWKTQYQCDFPAQPIRRTMSMGALMGNEDQPARPAYNLVAKTNWPMARVGTEVTMPAKGQPSPTSNRMSGMMSPTRNKMPATLLRAGGMVMGPKAVA